MSTHIELDARLNLSICYREMSGFDTGKRIRKRQNCKGSNLSVERRCKTKNYKPFSQHHAFNQTQKFSSPLASSLNHHDLLESSIPLHLKKHAIEDNSTIESGSQLLKTNSSFPMRTSANSVSKSLNLIPSVLMYKNLNNRSGQNKVKFQISPVTPLISSFKAGNGAKNNSNELAVDMASERLWKGLGISRTVRCSQPTLTELLNVNAFTKSNEISGKYSSGVNEKEKGSRVPNTVVQAATSYTSNTKVSNQWKSDDDHDDRQDVRKSRNYYAKRMPTILQCSRNGPYYIHSISFHLESPNPGFKYNQYFPQKDNLSLGIIASSILPMFGPLSFYSCSGIHIAKCTFHEKISLDPPQLDRMKVFHRYIFSDVLKITNCMQYNEKDFLVVPLKGKRLDYEILERVIKRTPQRMSIDEVIDQQVIFPTYKKKIEHYFIEEKVSFMDVDSKIPGLNKTFREYYKEAYDLDLAEETQPLLRISSANKRSCMLQPISSEVVMKKKKDIYETTLFVPELMGLEPLPAGLWKQAQILPFLLHRICSFMSVSQMLSSLDFNITGSPMNFESLHSKNDVETFRCLLMTRKSHGRLIPSSGDLLQAVTLKSANDQFDMERLEILGDVFLKYSTGVFLYYKSAEESHINAGEGELTIMRAKVVGNSNLFLIGESINLQNTIVSFSMEPRSTWQPPGYDRLDVERRLIDLEKHFQGYLPDSKKRCKSNSGLLSFISEDDFLSETDISDDELLNFAAKRCLSNEYSGYKLRSFTHISEKSVADCVEALIGTFLYNAGQEEALKFMAKIGINLSASSSIPNLFERIPSKSEDFVHLKPQKHAIHGMSSMLYEAKSLEDIFRKLNLSKVESIIGYRFKQKSFLLQALTHSSYNEHRLTECYERLEYLGDAVLDYVVTIYIYCYSDGDQGKITDTRSALVNNDVFGCLLVEHELHRFILHNSLFLDNKIKEYIMDKQKSNQKRRIGNSSSCHEVLELELVEIPKVLGDVFEAIIGAVYIDSGHNLELIWRIYRKLYPKLQSIVNDPPLNIKKELMERFPQNVFFTEPELLKDGRVSVVVTIKDGEKERKFRGLGQNKLLASMAACKLALENTKCSKQFVM